MFHGCFLIHIKTVRCVVPLIVLGERKVSAGLEIHPKMVLKRASKALREREKGEQGA